MQSAPEETDLTSVSVLRLHLLLVSSRTVGLRTTRELCHLLGRDEHIQADTRERTTAPLLLLLLSAVSCVTRNCAQQAVVDKKAFSANPLVFTIKVTQIFFSAA